MSTNTTNTGSVKAISEIAARVSFWAAAAFVALLAAMHLLEPEFDPSWRFISEYELGHYGWAMQLAFFSLAASYIALAIAIHSQLRSLMGHIGLALLLISALGLAMAGIFKTDPITTSPDAVTTSGMLHGIGGSLGIAMTFSAAIVSWQLVRIPAWALARRPLLWTAGIAVACSIGFIIYLTTALPSDGTFGPGIWAGGIGRIEILAYSAWLMVAASQAIKVC
jgi:hypothetical membrane protein